MSGETPIRWPRKVLVSYFFGSDTIPLGESVAQALEESGCEVVRFDCRVEHRLQPIYKRLSRLLRPLFGRSFDLSKRFAHDNETVRNRALENLANHTRPDLLLAMRGNSFDADVLRRIKTTTGCTTVSWCLYGPEALESTLRPDIGAYDHIFAVYQSGLQDVRFFRSSHGMIDCTARGGLASRSGTKLRLSGVAVRAVPMCCDSFADCRSRSGGPAGEP